MINRSLLNLFLITGVLAIFSGQAFSQSERSRPIDYVIQVETPAAKEEVGQEVQAKGRVFIAEQDNVRSDMILLSFIRPATFPRYFVQDSTRVGFDKRETQTGEIRYEANWELTLNPGAAEDFGKKYYVYFVLIGKRSLLELKDMEENAKGKGIERVVFEKRFLNDASQYYTMTDRIPIYRKFPDRK